LHLFGGGEEHKKGAVSPTSLGQRVCGPRTHKGSQTATAVGDVADIASVNGRKGTRGEENL